ncbi:protein kinase domain-containing protein [Rhodopirellula baltica]|nr:protein kinase [Rhodopirellula baltica]
MCQSKLPIREAVSLVATLADGLQYAHKQGCIHRDIKPANILINGEGTPLIADFGVACTLDELAKGRSSSSGTLNYMAPEQIAQETQLLDGRCDVHALGVLLFELLSGRSPFQSRTQNGLREQILFRQPTLLRSADPSLPKELEAICSKALAKHPADRHESAAEFATELRNWLERASNRRRITWIVMVILLLLALVTGVLIALSGGGSETNGTIQDGVMNFDGRTRVVTNLERTLPVTLEAWIKPDQYTDENCQFIIGSDIPGEYGLGIALCGSLLSVEHVEGMVNSSAAVVPGVWSHVAAVFTKTDTRLFLNGELVATASGSSKGGSTNFVIGNVGQDKLLDFFRGQIRSVRVSSGERYGEVFEPSNLSRDQTTLLLLNETASVRDESILDQDGEMLGTVEGH